MGYNADCNVGSRTAADADLHEVVPRHKTIGLLQVLSRSAVIDRNLGVGELANIDFGCLDMGLKL